MKPFFAVFHRKSFHGKCLRQFFLSLTASQNSYADGNQKQRLDTSIVESTILARSGKISVYAIGYERNEPQGCSGRALPSEFQEMLVLSRKKNESIIIDDKIVITVIEIRGDKVRLGIEAPREVAIHRSEVRDAIAASEVAIAQIQEEPLSPQDSKEPSQIVEVTATAIPESVMSASDAVVR